MKSILMDQKTGMVFSEILGWNEDEASVREDSRSVPMSPWSRIIYRYTGGMRGGSGKPYENWEGRELVCVSVSPFGDNKMYEPEIFT